MEEADVGWIIPFKDILFLEEIGNGAFGKVNKGKYNGEVVAIKRLHPQRCLF